ncbi:MAG TPA: DNA polymerase I [Candidatus Acidoferrum sp.]|nr:DNA polymerase I [Candidatus Acidoferrum sp.]
MADIAPLVLVDGSSYLFRAYHALPPLNNTKGQATGAIKGVINMIRSLVKQYPHSRIAVVFDAKGKTFRDDIYPEYKAHRPPMPDDLRTQIEPIHHIIRAMGLPLLVVDGVEADDVIGTLAQEAWKQKMPTLISTGDKDMAQLVNEHVTLLNTMTNEKLDIEGVKNKFGLPPERIIDYLALMGDSVDNIPGVPGVGPKTAVKWLQEYGSVDALIAQADKVGGKVGENLRANIDVLKLSRVLATIKLDVALEFGPQNLEHKSEDKNEMLALFRELEFKSWIKELEEQGAHSPPAAVETGVAVSNSETPSAEPWRAASQDYRIVTELGELKNFVRALAPQSRLAIELLTDDAHFKQAQLTGIALSNNSGTALYVPLGHDMLGAQAQLPLADVVTALKPMLEDRAIFKVGHDLKYTSHVLARHGIKLGGRRYDTMLQSYVLDSVAHKHTLELCSEHYLQETLPELDSVLGKGRNKLTFAQLDIAKAGDYAARRVDLAFRLHHYLAAQLASTGQLAEVYRYFEIALLPVLARMEDAGIRVDVSVLATQSQQLATRLVELERKAYELAGEEFNLGSPVQLQKIFFEKLGYPVLAKTDKGQPSTAEPVLQELAETYELPKVILEQRGLAKLKSTYTDKLPLDIQQDTGRIHSTFQQAVAATGRLSSMDPNLQNIPIRTEEGRRIRTAFIADKGKVLLAADYSQVELRIMAHLSGDPGLVKAFAEGLDVHRATAAEIFGLPLDKVTSDQRRSAKAINFGLIYGMSAFGLAAQLGIGRGEAQEYVERYFHRYPGVRDYMDNTRLHAAEQGFVETLFGRRLYLPDIKARNPMLRKAAERTAINAPMQGTAADIIKQAMIDIDHWLDVASLDARMVLQVHDELVFEVAEPDLPLLMEGVRFRMVSAAALSVPLVVDMGHGRNWDQAH